MSLKPTYATKWDSYFHVAGPGLRAYFGRIRRGNDVEYRTTFYKGRDLESVLSGWDSTLNTLSGDWPTLVEFEKDLRSKVGPLSIMKPLRDRLADIDSYYDSILLESKPISDEAVAATLKWFQPIQGLRLRNQVNTVDKMRKSTNSGCPYFTKRSLVTSDTVPFTLEPGWQILPTGKYGICAILGWRGQEGGPDFDDVKQRVVWMFPYAINIAELQCYQPLIEACQRHNLVPAWVSMEAVDDRITRLFDTKNAEDPIICTDFSKFDQHFNPVMQSCAHRLLSQILTGDASCTQWLEEVFPIKYDIPIAFDYGHIRYGRHGMASGSGGTNADETLVHRALQYEAALNHKAELNPNSMCLGDDGILTYPGIKVTDVVASYSSHGQVMNLDKQYVSTDTCIYLRRWHHKDYRQHGRCVGVYSTYRALGRLCEQERYYDPKHWGPEMVALRQLSILENVKYHPLREQFADYCMEGDKYRLGLDLPGFFDNLEQVAKAAQSYMPDFLGYTKSLQTEAKEQSSGIDSWWIVNYLKSKR